MAVKKLPNPPAPMVVLWRKSGENEGWNEFLPGLVYLPVQTLSYRSPVSRPIAPAAPRTTQPLLYHVGFVCLLVLLFVNHSRLAETLASVTGLNFRIVLILAVASLLPIFLLGRFVSRVKNSLGVVLVLLTGWFLACVPTSYHRGGSVVHLNSYWFSTVLIALLAMAYPEDSKTMRRMLYAVASGMLLVALLRSSQTVFTIGSLDNPNLYGQHLLYSIPFLFLPILRNGVFSLRGLACSLCIILLVAKIVAVGSRSSLLAVIFLTLILFLHVPFVKKLLLLAMAVPAILFTLAMLPQGAIYRYSTLISQEGSNRILTEEELSAIESAEARKYHLEQSIKLTLQHPVFGVGPGMFTVADAAESESRGMKAHWKETHNSITQISSETGFPGLALYLTMSGLIGAALWRTMRMGRRAKPGTEAYEISSLATVMLYSFLAFMITGTFSSSAYLSYLPLLGGFAFAANRLGTAAATARPVPKLAGQSSGKDPQCVASPGM